MGRHSIVKSLFNSPSAVDTRRRTRHVARSRSVAGTIPRQMEASDGNWQGTLRHFHANQPIPSNSASKTDERTDERLSITFSTDTSPPTTSSFLNPCSPLRQPILVLLCAASHQQQQHHHHHCAHGHGRRRPSFRYSRCHCHCHYHCP